MQARRRLLGQLNLQKKITLLLVLFILVPLTLFGYLIYQRSNDFVAERTAKETNQVLHLVSQNSDRMLSEYEKQLMSIYENEEAIVQLSGMQSFDTTEGRQTEETMNRFLRNFLIGKSDLESVYLFSEDRVFFADYKGSEYFQELFRQHPDWQESVIDGNGRAVWIPTYELQPNRYLSETTRYFSVGMQVRNVADVMQTLGTIYVNVKLSALSELVEDIRVSPRGMLLITDGDGHVIWHRNDGTYNQTLNGLPFYEHMKANREDSLQVQLNGEAFQMNYVRSNYNGWYYVSFIPHTDLSEQSKELRQFLIVTIVAFGASVLLLAVSVTLFVTRPIRKMALAMKQVHKENADLQLPAVTEDEIGLLQTAFNTMRRRMNELIQEVRIVSEKEKEAEVRALQAQINPHFVYNSLDTINWMAIDRKQHDISSMITALSDIMRYAIRPGEYWISLSEELKWARNYAYLQKMRFEDRFEIVFDADPDLLDKKVPRLFLQPYLENAILHGMEHIDSGGLIQVTVTADEETGGLRVVVKDNGSGIPEDLMNDISQRRSLGIGLYNLDDRMKLSFGSAYGVTIDSKPGEGTSVTIILPLTDSEKSTNEE